MSRCFSKFLLTRYEGFLLYNKKEKNISLELDISHLSTMSYMLAMYYMLAMLYMIDILYMSYKQGMSYQHGMSYLSSMLLYVYVYDTILSIYTYIFMFHVKHLYSAL